MKTLLGILTAGGLVLALASPSHAQVYVQRGWGGSPTISFGQPTYGQYAQPGYQQPGYRQPGYYQPYGVRSYTSGYSGYAAPGRSYAQPYYGSGTGLSPNGRGYMRLR